MCILKLANVSSRKNIWFEVQYFSYREHEEINSSRYSISKVDKIDTHISRTQQPETQLTNPHYKKNSFLIYSALTINITELKPQTGKMKVTNGQVNSSQIYFFQK